MKSCANQHIEQTICWRWERSMKKNVFNIIVIFRDRRYDIICNENNDELFFHFVINLLFLFSVKCLHFYQNFRNYILKCSAKEAYCFTSSGSKICTCRRCILNVYYSLYISTYSTILMLNILSELFKHKLLT